MTKPIVLAGFPGAGKTTAGAILAGKLHWSFGDGDVGITSLAGISVMDIFNKDGEEGFRAWERKFYLATTLSHCSILAVGGGSLLDEEVRTCLEGSARVVCLTVHPEIAWLRLKNDYPRPLLVGSDGLSRLKSLWEDRAKHYGSFPLRLDTSRLTLDETAEAIIKMLAIKKTI